MMCQYANHYDGTLIQSVTL